MITYWGSKGHIFSQFDPIRLKFQRPEVQVSMSAGPCGPSGQGDSVSGDSKHSLACGHIPSSHLLVPLLLLCAFPLILLCLGQSYCTVGRALDQPEFYPQHSISSISPLGVIPGHKSRIIPVHCCICPHPNTPLPSYFGVHPANLEYHLPSVHMITQVVGIRDFSGATAQPL